MTPDAIRRIEQSFAAQSMMTTTPRIQLGTLFWVGASFFAGLLGSFLISEGISRGTVLVL